MRRKLTKRYAALLKAGENADKRMRKSGLGYAAEEVHAYLIAKVRGRRARRPKPVRWHD